MATQTLPHVTVFPQLVPAVVEIISQTELELILSLRARLATLEQEIATAEASIEDRLAGGAEVELGRHTAALKVSSRRNVSWKAVAVRLANRLKLDGEAYVARVLAATKPDRTISLVIN
jgi:hypothetical protein